MERQSRHRRTQIEDGVFVALVVLVSIAFALVVEPFFGAILWGVIVAILFIPVNQGLLKLIPGHRNSAALLTLLLIIAIVIVPAIILSIALVQEATALYAQINVGKINIPHMFAQFQAALPDWASIGLRRLGISNFAAVQRLLTDGLTASFRTVAAQAFLIGQSAFSFLIALTVSTLR